MDERLILAVDGGATTTVGLLATAAGRILGVGQAGPSNHIHEPGGEERLRRAVGQVAQQAFANAGLAARPLACACYGMTNAIATLYERVRAIIADTVAAETMRLVHDTVNAHAGALGGEPGVIVIGGTGSVAYGVNAAGDEFRAGGWGYLMGDEGSGYWIAIRALSAITKAADGRIPPTRLTDGLLQATGAADLWALHRTVYYETPRAELGKLAATVGRLAAEGDTAAQTIMADAGRELAAIALAALRHLRMTDEAARVATIGGVFRAGDVVLTPFTATLQAAVPRVQVQPPRYPPVVGSLLLALRALDVMIDAPLLAAMEASLAHFPALKR